MSKINVLHSTIYNRIAAGEVVERPFSVVKELVENSIDAGATEITITILNGGLEKIVVTDNGNGILQDDLNKVFMPHSTSKIATISDLEKISTLGFRGEAMPSIASVSKMMIISKSSESDCCYSLECNGGTLGQINECSGNVGTTVIVNNLFYNTPVRAKFLKSNKSEQSEITNIVSRFILGNPKLSFKYIADDKIIFQSYGDGLEEATISVYGVDAINNSFKIESNKNGIGLTGYIGKHNYTKSNRTYQNLFINGRYIINGTVSSAIMNAYASYLMKRQYPFYIINLNVPLDIIDVNVHPNKTDVRFSNNQVIYSTIYSVLSSVLDGKSSAINIVKNDIGQYNNSSTALQDKKSFYNLTQNVDKTNLITNSENVLPYIDRVIEPTIIKVCDHSHNGPDIFKENQEFLNDSENIVNLQNIVKTTQNKNMNQAEINFDEIKYIGQAFNTYLLYEISSNIYIIDQHAAHEKLLYDNYLFELDNNKLTKQGMIIPYILNVNYQEHQFIQENLDVLNKMGFELEDFGGNSFKLSELPSNLTHMNVKLFFNDFLSDIKAIDKSDSEFLKAKIAQMACKAAIKGGDTLSKLDAHILFKQIKGDLGLKCPHGRPVVIQITALELEKWFKRSL